MNRRIETPLDRLWDRVYIAAMLGVIWALGAVITVLFFTEGTI